MNNKNKALIEQTIQFVKRELEGAEAGHDWFHIERVWNLAKQIGKVEQVDMQVVELAALLHDIADSKFHDGNEDIGPQKAREFLESLSVAETVIDHVEKIIRNVSHKGHYQAERTWSSPELLVVQDADGLDAIGAIGIGRTFVYGGNKGRVMWDPNKPPQLNMTKEEYKKNEGSTINHFYEKLLLLKDLMHTKTGREIAKGRDKYMREFLERFYAEWKGEK